jgi:hypothetical protein
VLVNVHSREVSEEIALSERSGWICARYADMDEELKTRKERRWKRDLPLESNSNHDPIPQMSLALMREFLK